MERIELRCERCNGKLTARGNNKYTCEYCDTDVILIRPIQNTFNTYNTYNSCASSTPSSNSEKHYDFPNKWVFINCPYCLKRIQYYASEKHMKCPHCATNITQDWLKMERSGYRG